MVDNIYWLNNTNFEQFQHLISPRYAGRKAVIVKPSDEGTSDKPFRYSWPLRWSVLWICPFDDNFKHCKDSHEYEIILVFWSQTAHCDHEPRVFKHFKSNFQPRPGRWHRQVPQEGHQEDVQEKDSKEVQGQAFPEGMCHRDLASESDDIWPKLQRFFGKWVLFLVSDLYP